MNNQQLEIAVGGLLLSLVVICGAGIIVGALWTIVFNIKAIKAVNRMGVLRTGLGRCHDLGIRLVFRAPPPVVRLLLLGHAYVHSDDQVRAFGECAFRYLANIPRVVFVVVFLFEALFFLFSLVSLSGSIVLFLTTPDSWLAGILLLLPSIVFVPVFWYTLRASRRHRRFLARMFVFVGRLKREKALCGKCEVQLCHG